MTLLALDTTSRPASAAVLARDRALAVRCADRTEPPSTRLPADLTALLRDAGLELRDVDVFGVAVGPGSFTGLRVGIATIQGLALVFRRPVVPVSTLDAWAWRARVPAPARTAVWIDAQRGEVYAARYAPPGTPGGEPEADAPPLVGTPRAILEAWRTDPALGGTDVVFVGDGASRYSSEIRAALGASARVIAVGGLTAVAVGEIAVRRVARGEAVPPHAIVPAYVRRPDAELARDRRRAAANGPAEPARGS